MQCLIYDNKALNFFRAICGFLPLLAFLTKNEWLILLTAILFLLGAFSMRFNFLYQFYGVISNKMMKKEIMPIEKDPGELKFVYSFTAICFFLSFALIYYGKFVNFGWGLDLLVSFLTLLASFANICLAAMMYVIFKKVFVRQ